MTPTWLGPGIDQIMAGIGQIMAGTGQIVSGIDQIEVGIDRISGDAGVLLDFLTLAIVQVGVEGGWVTFDTPFAAAAALVLFGSLSILVAGTAGVLYRWYFRDALPEGIAILLGVAIVALYLNTASLGALVVEEGATVYEPSVVFFNVVAIGVAAATAPAGKYVGDSIARNTFALTGGKNLEGEVSKVVRTVGRITAVSLPAAEDIEDVEGYEPVTPEKKAEMAKKTMTFPRRITVDDLRKRLVARIKEDYGIGYVDVDLADDGTIEYLAVGSRAAGIGPTLAPGTVAMAVQADPAQSATPGDIVQVWSDDGTPSRITTAELRATVDDVATLAVDEADAEKLSPDSFYRLVTLPAEPQADREFASLLRSADETMAAITVEAGAPVVGKQIQEIDGVVAAVRPETGTIQAIPPRQYTIAVGDTVYLIGRPGVIRRFETASRSADGDDATETTGSELSGEAGDADSPPDSGRTTESDRPFDPSG